MCTKPKDLFNRFSGFQLLRSSVRTLILYNAAELSHFSGEGQRSPVLQPQAFYSPDFLSLSPLPNGSTRRPYPPVGLRANYGTAALQGISLPEDHDGCSASCRLPSPALGQSITTVGKTHSQKPSGVEGERGGEA